MREELASVMVLFGVVPVTAIALVGTILSKIEARNVRRSSRIMGKTASWLDEDWSSNRFFIHKDTGIGKFRFVLTLVMISILLVGIPVRIDGGVRKHLTVSIYIRNNNVAQRKKVMVLSICHPPSTGRLSDRNKK